MTIYCESCNENHDFTKSQAEALIYGLQATLSEYMTGRMPVFNEDCSENYQCLKAQLDAELDYEVHGEWIEIMRGQRREKSKPVADLNAPTELR